MHAVREEDDEHAASRDRSTATVPVKPGVAERAERKQLAAVATRTPSRCPSRGRARCRIAGGVAGVVIRATVSGDSTRAPSSAPPFEQHAAETREVGGRAEQARVAGDAAHPPRGRIVHDAAQQRRVRRRSHGHAERRARSRSARCRGRSDGRRHEHRVRHAERLEDARRAQTRSSGSPADARDDVAEQEEVDVAVDEPLARRGDRHFVDGEPIAAVRSRLHSRRGRRRAAARTRASADGGW